MNNPNQKIQNLKVSDLKLWSENPRDPISSEATDLEIIRRAIDENPSDWNLDKMISEMGSHYDMSELPTVVIMNDKPVVFDGNRRVASLKYIQDDKLYSLLTSKIAFNRTNENFRNFTVIPCNVCDIGTALKNVYRKHAKSGSWNQAQRDYFEHKYMGKDKSYFLRFMESAGLDLTNKKLNQRYVKDELFTEDNLSSLGLNVNEKGLTTRHSPEETAELIRDIVSAVEAGKTNTRKNRGDLNAALLEVKPEWQSKITLAQEREFAPLIEEKNDSVVPAATPGRHTRRTKSNPQELFGGKLILIESKVNNAYIDIRTLYEFYMSKKNKDGMFTSTFPSLIRMALRLLTELASSEPSKKGIDTYLEKYFPLAKADLDQNMKTYLNAQNVSELGQFKTHLHTGAHDYDASSNLDQTVAISVMLGEMLKKSHGIIQ